MGAKSSKAAVVIDPSKANIYDTFSNYQDTDDVDTSSMIDFTKDYVINDKSHIYSIIMGILLVYSIVLYSFIYLRRRRTKYSYK
jgi:hypothetical protein